VSDKPQAAPVMLPRGTAEVAGMRITHADKVLYPESGITKLELARYYEQVAERMLPELAGRPLTLVRCPDGWNGECFYQKHAMRSVMRELSRIEIPEKSGSGIYLIADDLAGLMSLVQMGVLEIHVWGSTRKHIEQPDRVVFDFDPDEGLPWPRVIEAAIELRELLAGMGLASFAKVTGGKGLHVVLPVTPKHDWDAVKAFAHAVAQEIVRREPLNFTRALPKTWGCLRTIFSAMDSMTPPISNSPLSEATCAWRIIWKRRSPSSSRILSGSASSMASTTSYASSII
jgi:bifunctional non-homologous end joining protein LigD